MRAKTSSVAIRANDSAATLNRPLTVRLTAQTGLCIYKKRTGHARQR